ncbi:MAG: DUF1054 domain-containing protein [Bacilli bacterium]
MNFNGFEESDFTLFDIPGLEERMDALIKQLRPKFELFGKEFSSELALITGEEMFPHVAKHARRKTNPPNDSWVAFSSNKRGYKMLPHFQIGLWASHVFIQWGIIYECLNKEQFSNQLIKHVNKVKKSIPNDYYWYKDHMNPEGIQHQNMKKDDFLEFARRLKENKNGEVMVGLNISKEDACKMSGQAFYDHVIETWSKLNELHRMSN